MYWHLYNTGTEDNKKKYLSMMYDDICLLEVLSNIAIDSAKRRYECSMASEIKKIKTRPYMTAQGQLSKMIVLYLPKQDTKRVYRKIL